MKLKTLLIFCLTVSTFSLFAQENAMKAGKKDGVWNYYSNNQNNQARVLLARHFYNQGIKTGVWEFYNIAGKLSWTYNFNTSTATYMIENTADGYHSYMTADGKWTKSNPDTKTIWLASESQWNNFLVNNLKMHEESVPERIPGKVDINVTVDTNGKAIAYKIGNDVEKDLDKEALRVAKLFSPEFIPAVVNGQKVKSIYVLHVSYKLADYR